MKEIYKTVVFRNKTWKTYEVSNLGNVRSVDRIVDGKSKNQFGEFTYVKAYPGKKLSPKVGKQGYLYVGLAENGKVTTAKIHRLVAETFIPNPENKKTVNHRDEIKSNNAVENLEWLSTKENNKYGSRFERFKSIEVSYPNGKLFMKFDSLREASEFLGISRKTILKFVNNEHQVFRAGGKNTYFKNYTFRLCQG